MTRRGLTLIELVVALAITGVAMAAGFGAIGSVLDQRGRVEQAGAAIASAAAERGELISWLGGTHLTVEEGGPSFRGLDGTSGDSADDELTVLSTRGGEHPAGARPARHWTRHPLPLEPADRRRLAAQLDLDHHLAGGRRGDAQRRRAG